MTNSWLRLCRASPLQTSQLSFTDSKTTWFVSATQMKVMSLVNVMAAFGLSTLYSRKAAMALPLALMLLHGAADLQ